MASFEYNTEIFYVRTDINEFLREHSFVSDLYDVALQSLWEYEEAKEATLKMFNEAYYICTLAVGNSVQVEEIESMIMSCSYGFYKTKPIYIYCSVEAAVIKCLLRVHQELLNFDAHIIEMLDRIIKNNINPRQFDKVLKNYVGDFEAPLDFSGKSHAAPVRENICKDERIAELEKMLQMERQENFNLSMRLSSMVYYKEPSESPIDSDDEIYNAINYQTITEFACGRVGEEASTIANMIARLALREKLSGESASKLYAAIDKIDNAIKLQASREIRCGTYVEMEVNNDNKDSQVFNGGITNSKFGK